MRPPLNAWRSPVMQGRRRLVLLAGAASEPRTMLGLLALGVRLSRAVERRLVVAHDRRVANECWEESGLGGSP